jgi:hypothetical protein
MESVQRLFIILAGALVGAVGSYYITHHEKWIGQHRVGRYTLYLFVILLLLAGWLPLETYWDNYQLKGARVEPYQIGILADMQWDETRPVGQFATGTDVSIEKWKKQIEEDAPKDGIKVSVRTITSDDNFYS